MLPVFDDGSNPYAIICPTCGARPGQRCTSRNVRQPTHYSDPHITRRQEAQNGFSMRLANARAAIARRRAVVNEDAE